MQFAVSILALATSLLSVSAHEHGHSHLHQHAHQKKDLEKRTIQVNSLINLIAPLGGFAHAQEGPGLAFTNNLVNNSTQSATIVVWSGMNFAVAGMPASVPDLVVELPASSTKVISFSNQFSGAYAAIWSSTGPQLSGGIAQPWVELTSSSNNPVVDVSFLTHMSNKYVTVETDCCISDWTSCSFKCNDGSPICMAANVAELIACQGDSTCHNWDDGGGHGPWNGGCNLSPTFTTTFGGPGN